MCGICGWIDHNRRADYNYQTLKKMMDTLYHRGPDENGYWIEGNVALGHQRLSIVDLDTGQQPMFGNNDNIVIFNGEIYNYKELREELKNKGFVFRTTSDTEVLLKAYENWGINCLNKFIGMFSFVIWNPTKKELFIARDRLGKKPLYYYQSKSLFAFASELKALLILPEVKTSIEINVFAVSDYLSLGYILTPKTIFTTINKLPAGHYAIYRVAENKLTLYKYWNLEDFFLSAKDSQYNSSMNYDFLEILNDAVKIRMRSDVPLGAFLSGGIDSSSVVASMSRYCDTKIHAFCIGFNEEGYDESNFANVASRHLNVDLQVRHYHYLSDTELSKLIWHFDEPFADNSFVPTFQLNKLASENVTVSLSGDGADEVLAGYPTYRADRFFKIYSLMPIFFQRKLYQVMKNILRPSYKKVGWDYKIIQFLKSYGSSPEIAHYWWRVVFSEDEKKRIMNHELLKMCRDYNPFETFHDYFTIIRQANFLDQTLYVDIKTWLQDDILVKVDRMSMANSLEVRSPFLDHRLVELSARLPESAKINRKEQKVILKSCMKKYLPDKTLYRVKKGFNTPLDMNRLTSLKESVLLSGTYHLNPEKEDVTFKAFNLFVLQKWLDIYEQFKITGRWEPVEYDA